MKRKPFRPICLANLKESMA